MRLLHLVPLVPFLLQAAPPISIEDATAQILEAHDADRSPLPRPLVKAKDRASLDWLREALGESRPRNPFLRGSRFHKEAESVRALLEAGSDFPKFNSLKPMLAGSHAALWRWGQTHAREGAFPIPQRHAWEDVLLRKGGPGMIRGWALRHALSFALAEGDETRLLALKTKFGDELPNVFPPFQRAFSLLGGPAPRFYLWSLPDLQPLDLSFSRMGSRVFISPLELPAPPDSAWIIPAPTTDLPTNLSTLEGASLTEAKRLSEQIRAMGREAYLAPSRSPLEALALVYFPIDIRMDGAGKILSIRMGDAAYSGPVTE